MQLEGIDHVALSVGDVERSAQWYIDVLGFERKHQDVWDGIPTFIAKGNTAIALFPIKAAAGSTSPATVASAKAASPPAPIRMLHLAFRANRENFRTAQKELEHRGIKFEFQDHEISRSIYFSDPDDHKLEITTYEI